MQDKKYEIPQRQATGPQGRRSFFLTICVLAALYCLFHLATCILFDGGGVGYYVLFIVVTEVMMNLQEAIDN